MLKFRVPLLLLGLSWACKSSNSQLASQGPVDCSDAGHLERVLSLLDPTRVAADRRLCISRQFQEAIGPSDRYDLAETQKASSQLRGAIYTKDNVFDRKVYIRGPSIFKAQRRLIAEAQEEVLYQSPLWEPGSASAQEILNGLKDLQESRRKLCPSCRPVIVRFIRNGEASDDSQAFTGFGFDPKILDLQMLTYKPKGVSSSQSRSLVVDGQIAMITGASAQRNYDPDINWYDLGFVMGGEVARGLRTDLINTMIREKDGAESLAKGLGTLYGKTFNTIYPLERMMEQPLVDKAGIAAVIAGRNGIESTNLNNTQNRALQALLVGATKRLHVQTPELNEEAVIRGLSAAVKRGVRVELILSRNCPTQRGIFVFLKDIGAAAPQGPLHDIRWYSMIRDSAVARVPASASFLSVDDEAAVIGSAKMNVPSWQQTRGLNVLVFHPELVKAWHEQVFATNYQSAQTVTGNEVVETQDNCK